MGTYKVLQDIEAEDKFVGPLTLRQFIYAAIAAVCIYASFFALSRGIWVVLVILSPIILFTGFLAWPWSRDQPTEVWLLARIRFMIKPRRRIWDQSGLKQLVTITVPKKIDKQYTNNLTPTEVKSRLQALADTIDSRGWAVKNVNVNLTTQQNVIQTISTDRLVDPSSLPQEVSASDITASDDMLDPRSNPVAQQLDQMVAKSAQEHRSELIAMMQGTNKVAQQAKQQAPNDYWFMNEPAANLKPQPGQSFYTPVTVRPGDNQTATAVASADEPTTDEQALLQQLHNGQDDPVSNGGHLKTILPLSVQKQQAEEQARIAAEKAQQEQAKTVTRPSDPAILELAKNDDLNVATLARQAQKATERDLPDDEVVISLH